MSEFSENLHFRDPISLEEQELVDALEASALRGVLLPPSNGWRTFVPFKSAPMSAEMEETNGARLAVVVGVPVVEYHFAEDYYWLFYVWINADLMTFVSCDLRGSAPRTEGEFEPILMASLLPPDGSIEALQELLFTLALTHDEGRLQAKHFVRMMGLTNAEFTGPHYMADDFDRLRGLEGVVIVGKPPAKRRRRSM